MVGLIKVMMLILAQLTRIADSLSKPSKSNTKKEDSSK